MLYRADWLARLMTLLMLGMASLAAWPNLTSGDFAWPQASVGADSPPNPLSYQENSAPRGGECVGYACFGQVANQAAGKLISNEGWKETDPQAVALHAVIGLAQGAIAGGGDSGVAVATGAGAAAGTYSAAALQQYLWRDYLHGGSIRPDTPEGQEIISLASAAVGAGVGAMAGAGSGSTASGAVLGSSVAASSTLYNQEVPADEEAARPDGPDGEPLTDQQIVDEHDYYTAYNELAAIDPGNPALGPSLQTQNWVPSEQDVAAMNQALATAQEINYLNTTPQGQQTLVNDAPVGTETVSQADQAALKAAETAAGSGTQILVNSAGDASVTIQGEELSIHAATQATIRGISLDDISAALGDGTSFSYVQNGQTLTGYYEPLSNTFVGVGSRITTVINPSNPSNYLLNLLGRGP